MDFSLYSSMKISISLEPKFKVTGLRVFCVLSRSVVSNSLQPYGL